jgi:hypothetical protein
MESYVDWAKVPDGKKWVAADDDGKVYGFRLKPNIHPYGCLSWSADNENGELCYPSDALDPCAVIAPLPPWKDSLIARPKE